MSDESLPAGSPYADYPAPLMETLRRSYRERRPGSWHLANGFAWATDTLPRRSSASLVDTPSVAAAFGDPFPFSRSRIRCTRLPDS